MTTSWCRRRLRCRRGRCRSCASRGRSSPAIAEGYREKRDLLVGGLREIGFAVTPPEGAYYLFADYRRVPALAAMSPTQAAMFLIEKGGGGHGAGRQLLRHRTRGRALPAIRLLPLARDAGGRHRTAPCGASLASGRAQTGFARVSEGDADHSCGWMIGAYPSAAARSSTSSAHWFRLLPDSSAARAALRWVSGLTRNITRPE